MPNQNHTAHSQLIISDSNQQAGDLPRTLKHRFLSRSCIQSVLLCSSLAIMTGNTFAETFSFEGDIGRAIPGSNEYHDGFSMEISAAYHWDSIIVRIGGLKLDDIDLADVDNSDITIDGQYIEISKEFDHRNLSLEIGAGYLDAETEAYYLDRLVTENDDSSAFLNVKGTVKLSRIFALVLDWKYIEDISGEDLSAAQLGARFSF
ncbi:hypothetical protein TDB9533_01416 [Thalassocella blandensis]|nr:hypothetical protein TDB9533_01416 [Thalassocella blandensis]